MRDLNPHCVGEQLTLPGVISDEERRTPWFSVTMPNGVGVLAVQAEYDDIEKTVLQALDEDHRYGTSFGDCYGLELVPGELTYENIECVTGGRAKAWDLQTRSDETVVWRAHREGQLPYQAIRPFL